MIYTVTFNPAIDYLLYVPRLTPGTILRAEREKIFFGGKGINVSLILRELGVESTAMGFLAGFTGSAMEQELTRAGIHTDFVRLKKGFTRINVKLRSGEETDINGQGPEIDGAEVEALFRRLEALQAGDTLVLAGSVPQTLPPDIYERILELLSDRQIRFVVDATRDLLLYSLKYRPFLIKPNNDELGEIFGVPIETPEAAAECAARLRERGAQNVLVSMGGKGAVLVDETGKTHTIGAIKGKVVNTVGAGDSMVAGFIAGFAARGDYAYALRLGTAAGGATAFNEGLAKGTEILTLLQNMKE
jgi:1-phosphofructokinase